MRTSRRVRRAFFESRQFIHSRELSPSRARRFNISSKYRIIKPIGSGAYGIVVSAEDVTNGRRVAVKAMKNAFSDLVDARRILREVKLMRFFGAHENLVTLYDMEEPTSSTFEDVYVITELMETDLHRIINSRQRLTDDHTAYFLYQILRALKFIHSANVIHRRAAPSCPPCAQPLAHSRSCLLRCLAAGI